MPQATHHSTIPFANIWGTARSFRTSRLPGTMPNDSSPIHRPVRNRIPAVTNAFTPVPPPPGRRCGGWPPWFSLPEARSVLPAGTPAQWPCCVPPLFSQAVPACTGSAWRRPGCRQTSPRRTRSGQSAPLKQVLSRPALLTNSRQNRGKMPPPAFPPAPCRTRSNPACPPRPVRSLPPPWQFHP